MDFPSHAIRVFIRPGMIVAFPAGTPLNEVENHARVIHLAELASRYDSANPVQQENIRDAVLQHSIQLRRAAKRGEISEENFAATQRAIAEFSNRVAKSRKTQNRGFKKKDN